MCYLKKGVYKVKKYGTLTVNKNYEDMEKINLCNKLKNNLISKIS